MLNIPTITRSVRVAHRQGMHLRVCAAVAQMASGYDAEVVIERSGRRANARSILELAMLAAECGTELVMSARGTDAARAMSSLEALLQSRFPQYETV